MYDRYSLSLTKEKITRRFEVKVQGAVSPQYNIAPGNKVAIITDHQPRLVTWATWGISTQKKTPTHKLYISSEAEKTTPQTTQYLTQRCLILADGFYLWKKVSYKSRIPYRIILKWNMPFAIAGVWQTDAETQETECALVLTDTNDLIQPITARMPLILPLEQEKTWLQTDIHASELLQYVKPYPAEQMRAFTVSVQVNQLDLNVPEIAQPSQPTDQFGNYVLFE